MRKRSSYVPGKAIRDARAKKHREASLTSQEQVKLLTHLHVSVAAFIRGEACRQDWDNLAHLANLGEEIDRVAYASSYKGEFLLLQESLRTCGKRMLRLGKFGFTGPELESAKEALSLHEQQLAQVSRNQFFQAVDASTCRFRRGDIVTVTEATNG